MTELWRSLSNKFGLSYETLQRLLPALAGLAAGGVVMLAGMILARRTRRATDGWAGGALALVIFLALGSLLTPSPLMGGVALPDCGGDVISSYEVGGQALAGEIPPGALVYWAGGLSPAPLLYLPGARIFPPQLNGSYSRVNGSNSDRLYRLGLWNSDLAKQWLKEADYVLVEERSYRGSLRNQIDPAEYNELTPTPPIFTCREGSRIRVFRREK